MEEAGFMIAVARHQGAIDTSNVDSIIMCVSWERILTWDRASAGDLNVCVCLFTPELRAVHRSDHTVSWLWPSGRAVGLQPEGRQIESQPLPKWPSSSESEVRIQRALLEATCSQGTCHTNSRLSPSLTERVPRTCGQRCPPKTPVLQFTLLSSDLS
ncbi:unnamed protein product [Pleuronectes platessa]|uniref:Uncharacterized protein n=1 Tax=Pleuronectes platessa TaxID=8262 RepID=A0A9N7YF32_PLEPL|nr:unnamed protein product [Pleuronectes platessa]